MTTTVFISYSRADLADTNWLERLRMYLAPFGRQGTVDVWDDGRLTPGQPWQPAIERALDGAGAAVLLVGPAFLASSFVMDHELPRILDKAARRGLALFPLIVGYCAYEALDIGGLQSFNPPGQPLESLPRPEANRILNDLAIAVDRSARSARPVPSPRPDAGADLDGAMRKLARGLGDTFTAFTAQCRRRDALVAAVEKRLGLRNELEYEKFFLRHHGQLDVEERFEFDQIRAITEGPMQAGNASMLAVLDANPALLGELPLLTDLRQHLVFWLNKFERVFKGHGAMCVLYVGVEDGVPFPRGVDAAVEAWIRDHRPPGP